MPFHFSSSQRSSMSSFSDVKSAVAIRSRRNGSGMVCFDGLVEIFAFGKYCIVQEFALINSSKDFVKERFDGHGLNSRVDAPFSNPEIAL